MGNSSYAIGNNAIAIGSQAWAAGNQSIAIGTSVNNGSQAGIKSIGMGNRVDASGDRAIAVGATTGTPLFGTPTTATGLDSIAIGTEANATDAKAVAIGYKQSNATPYSVQLGVSPTLYMNMPDFTVKAAANVADRYVFVNISGSTYKLLLAT